MKRRAIVAAAFLLSFALVAGTQAYDQTGAVGVGYRFGLHTVGKDPWGMRFMHGGEFRLGLHPHINLLVTGTYGRTGFAVLDASVFPPGLEDADSDDPDRLRLTSRTIEVGPLVNLMPYDEFNVFLTAGIGYGTWSVKDIRGKKLRVPDGAGGTFELDDQQMTLMFGGGVEWWPWESVPEVSFNASLRYHLYTNAFSNFDDFGETVKTAVGKDGLDVPDGLLEFGIGVTAYFTQTPDQDHDGVPDDYDICPGTPECVDSVDEDGCPFDSDGDGVYNGCDSCPDTPHGCTIDLKGCSYDSDGDGICDGIDTCLSTPFGCEVDSVGCPLDSDKDGVIDCRDKCPDTPVGCLADSVGCESDEDGDGVCDGVDECAETPGEFLVDDRGCPQGLQIPNMVVLIMDILPDGRDFRPRAKYSLDSLAVALRANPTVSFEIQGHTDSLTAANANTDLSFKLAQDVRDYFVLICKLKPDRFEAVGYGREYPVPELPGRHRVELRRKN